MIVTSALPYSNYILHIGHIAGAYLPADIFVRYMKLFNKKVKYICGADEHGTPIALEAYKLGINPEDYINFFWEKQKEGFESLNIKFDIYSGTHRSKIHKDLVKKVFLKLFENGFLKEEIQELAYDPKLKKFLPDRFVRGKCPYCGYEKAHGEQCENCGKLLDAKQLINPKSALTGEKIVFKKTRHIFFKLSELKEDIKNYIESKKDIFEDWIYKWMIKEVENITDRPITRDIEWGIEIPIDEMKEIIKKVSKEKGISENEAAKLLGLINTNLDEYRNKVIYVWFEALLGYISFSIELLGNKYKEYWNEVYHFMGKDNIPFHVIIWPAILIALNKSKKVLVKNEEVKIVCNKEEYEKLLKKGYKPKNLVVDEYIELPYNIIGMQYLLFKGRKISKSQKWGVFLDRIKESGIDEDYYRFYLAYILPEGKDSNFDWEEFKNVIEKELIGNVGNLFHRVLSFIWNKYNGIVPYGKDEEGEKLLEESKKLTNKIEKLIKKGKFKEILKEILQIAYKANKYFQENEPWKGNKDYVLYYSFNIIKNIAILLYPYIPKSIEKILYFMNVELDINNINKEFFNHRINKPYIVFKKFKDWDKAFEIVRIPKDYSKLLSKNTIKVIGILKKDHFCDKIEVFIKSYENPWEKLKEELKKRKIKFKEKDDLNGFVLPDFVYNDVSLNLVYIVEVYNCNKKLDIDLPLDKITIDMFKRIDLRVGRIIKVEDIKESKKLYKLEIDLGKEKRIILAGLKNIYKPEELLNKQIIIVYNLKPKKILNYYSNGMLLATEEGILIIPEKEAKEGSKIG